MNRIIIFIFTLFCRFTGYGIGVALASAISAMLAITFGVYYASAINIPMTPEIVLTLYITQAVSWVLHSVQFGLLNRIGFAGFTASIRTVNRLIETRPEVHIGDNLTPHEYKALLKALIFLPVNNTVTGMFHVVFAILSLMIVGVFYAGYDAKILTSGAMMFLIIATIHGVIGFILGELFTSPMREQCKRKIHERGIPFQDRSLSTVRLKLIFLLVLFVVALYISNTLTYYHRDNLRSVIIFSIFAVVVALIMASLTFQMIYRSLTQVEKAVSDMERGGEGSIFSGSLDKEFINLAAGVTNAARTIKDYQVNLEKKVELRMRELQKALHDLEQRDREIQLELEFAAEIQKGIIPDTVREWNGVTIAGYWEAMEMVSGDYFDIFQLQGDRLGILVADVSGHGVPAALITTMAKVAFQTAGLRSNQPAEIFREVNNSLVRLITTQDYLTAFYVSMNENHEFQFANASHQYGLLVSENGKLERLDTEGLFIGALEEASDSYRQSSSRLRPGERLVLYSDGIVERKNREGDDYTNRRFEESIVRNRHLPVPEMVSALIGDWRSFVEGSERTDDVTLVVIGIETSYEEFTALTEKAFTSLQAGAREEALARLEEAVGIYSGNRNILRTAALLSYDLKRYELSEKFLNLYLQTDRENPEIWFHLAAVAAKQKDFTGALPMVEKALELKSGYPAAWNLKGICLSKAGDLRSAARAFEEALQLEPENQEVRKNLSSVRKKMG